MDLCVLEDNKAKSQEHTTKHVNVDTLLIKYLWCLLFSSFLHQHLDALIKLALAIFLSEEVD